MSFNTMNGINATRSAMGGVAPRGGLAGTVRRPAQYVQPGAPPLTGPAAYGQAQAQPAGMMGTHAMDTIRNVNDSMPDNGGVVRGVNPQAQLQQPQAPRFDPNDPENAALAGYMNGA